MSLVEFLKTAKNKEIFLIIIIYFIGNWREIEYKGLFVLRQNGRIVEIVNDDKFKPKEWKLEY